MRDRLRLFVRRIVLWSTAPTAAEIARVQGQIDTLLADLRKARDVAERALQAAKDLPQEKRLH